MAYRRGEIGSVSRALRVLDALRGFKRGRWITEIAKELGVSDRTVGRDIGDLQDAGYQIDLTRRDRKVIATLDGEQTYSPVPITKRERYTLFAVRNVFEVLQGTPFLDDVRVVMDKLEQRMTDKEREEQRTLGDPFLYMPDHGTKSYAGKEDIIDALQTGLFSRKLVRYRYGDGRGKKRDGYLAPFGLVLYRHGLYVIGAQLATKQADVSAGKLGVFATERFTEAETLRGTAFVIPPYFDIRTHLQGAFGPHLVADEGLHEVVVEFSSERASFATSRVWHPTQRIEPVSNGWTRIRFHVPSLRPIVSWVLEWGPHARAIAPEGLVTQVVSELQCALALYLR